MAREAFRTRSDYRWWQSITTRWSDNDAYGHVNNAIYYHWFDTVVNSWLMDAGLLGISNEDRIGLVVDTHCRYTRSIAYPEPVEIGLCLGRLGSSSVTYNLGAFVPGIEEAAAEASYTHVYVGRENRRPQPMPDHWRMKFDGLSI